MKLPFPKFLLKTPCKIYTTTLNEDGEDVLKSAFVGKCIYTNKQKTIMTPDRQLIMLSGKVVIEGNINVIEGSYVEVNKEKKRVFSIEKPINPDGSIFSTELNLS